MSALRPIASGIPSMLRPALLRCAPLLAAVLLLYGFAAFERAKWHSERDAMQAAAKETEARLTAATEAETTRMAHIKRLAAVRRTLEHPLPGEAEREDLGRRLADHPHIARPDLRIDKPTMFHVPEGDGLPSIAIQRLQIDVGLLHEGALLDLNAIVVDGPAHIVPAACSVLREKPGEAEEMPPDTLRARCDFDWIVLTPTGTAQ